MFGTYLIVLNYLISHLIVILARTDTSAPARALAKPQVARRTIPPISILKQGSA
jgi:hypothetical protein